MIGWSSTSLPRCAPGPAELLQKARSGCSPNVVVALFQRPGSDPGVGDHMEVIKLIRRDDRRTE